MSEQQGTGGQGIQGLVVDKLEGVSQLPDGTVALIVRTGDLPVGIIFKPDDARDAVELLESVWDTSEVEPDQAN